ncbi:MAG TPA: DUF4240 domain-containing protein [Gemmataceae bacterium]|nr:DUF4240 domain-containing protein [Gemmataceae bacterium]
MARSVPWLSRDEFWSAIEECRQISLDCESFAERLVAHLSSWGFAKLAAFHNTMWYDVSVFHRGTLWNLVYQQEPLLGSQNAWECYGGWLIAQGREYHESVMRDPALALTRLPTWQEIDAGETVIFSAQEACLRKTGRRYNLYDVIGDFLPAEAFSR